MNSDNQARASLLRRSICAHEARRQHAENWPGINSRANLLKLLRSSGTYCGAVPRRTARRVSRPARRAVRRVSRRSRRPARRS
jgi:hypothetical protein